MNQDTIAGSAKTLGGKVQEGVGRAVGEKSTEAEGLLNQAAGTAQEMYGHAKESASNAAAAVQRGASDAEDFVRQTIEKRPYTTALVALGVGWLIGRMGRRD